MQRALHLLALAGLLATHFLMRRITPLAAARPMGVTTMTNITMATAATMLGPTVIMQQQATAEAMRCGERQLGALRPQVPPLLAPLTRGIIMMTIMTRGISTATPRRRPRRAAGGKRAAQRLQVQGELRSRVATPVARELDRSSMLPTVELQRMDAVTMTLTFMATVDVMIMGMTILTFTMAARATTTSWMDMALRLVAAERCQACTAPAIATTKLFWSELVTARQLTLTIALLELKLLCGSSSRCLLLLTAGAMLATHRPCQLLKPTQRRHLLALAAVQCCVGLALP